VIHDICAELLDQMVARGGGDILRRFLVAHAGPGLRPLDEPVRRGGRPACRLGRQFNVAVQSADVAATKVSSDALYAMARHVVADRKARPLDPKLDVTSALLQARDKGQPLRRS
jgi:hypothetical protein